MAGKKKLSAEQIRAIKSKFETLKRKGPIKGYNVKLKMMDAMENPHLVTFKNGRMAVSGTSKKNGMKMFRIL